MYLPLDTLARGLGADYKTGDFSLPAAALTNVSSRAGKDTDRIVLDFSRDPQYAVNVVGNTLTLILKGVNANPQTYATRGAFVPSFTVTSASGDARLSLTLGSGAGYRLFKVVRPGSVRLVLDVGPGLPRNVAALTDAPRAPLIVLDPAPKGGGSAGHPAGSRARHRRTAQQIRLAGQADPQHLGPTARLPSASKLARQSQVFVTLSLGRFPGANRQGITLYQPVGEQNAQVINAYRDAASGSPLIQRGGGRRRRDQAALRVAARRTRRARPQGGGPAGAALVPGRAGPPRRLRTRTRLAAERR